MSKILGILLHTSALSSLLILFIFFLRFVFRGKINTKLQYALWIIVAVRLLIPFNFQWTVATKSPLSQIEIPNFASGSNQYTYQNDGYQPSVNRNIESYVYPTTEVSQVKAYKYNISQILFIIWIAGAIYLFAVFAMRNISFYRSTMKNVIPYNFSDNAYDEAAKVVGLNCSVPVYLSQSLTSPCVMGIISPVIILTDRVIHDTGSTKLALIHEMIHYKRRDNLIRLIGNILCALHWFNPLVWLSAEAARNDAELSCDSIVLKKIGLREHYNYCLTLISAVGSSNQAVAAMSSGGRKMKKRINMILNPPKNQTIAAVIAIVCLTVGLASFIKISAKAEVSWDRGAAEIASLGDVYGVYQLLTSLPNPNDNYKINSITINNMEEFKTLYLGYEFAKSDSVGGLDEDQVKKLNENALRLFTCIPDLNYIRISYFDKLANSPIPNTKAPISYDYHRNNIRVQSGDLAVAEADIENLTITPRIDNTFDQSMGGNNVILVYGYSEFISNIGVGKKEYVENSIVAGELFSKLGPYKERWKSSNSTMYRFSSYRLPSNSVYNGWFHPMIITDESGKIQRHGFTLSDLNN